MANLKRNMVELVTEVVEDEVKTQKFWSDPFIPMSVTYEALDLAEQMEKGKEREIIPKIAEFIASKVYGGKFTAEQFENGLHAPDAMKVIQEQIMFIAQGQQSDATRNFLENKN